ncbi:uncharacterized WD repeat-containing alr2800-like [Pelobates cultripes]|uniref:Uncharacterized WD repeat-containing alr2800-like n=1 Tax=Pelobates cultripes TaxID=61616 RepID=A0AAD1RS85_PELCU|nr:uncharacterized WD repeat-containing alr2800-like [Pelobates cultripes]
MAMQKHLSVRDCHSRSITALGFNSARREFLTGFEDGVIKWWDLESGRQSQSAAEHSGMVTNILYWAEKRLVFSSSNDGTLIAWTSGSVVFDKVKLGSPIFSLAINLRRQLLVCGFSKCLSVYPLDENKTSGHAINLKKRFLDHSHTDIVSCIVCLDSQIYTVGYDRKFIIFDTYQTPEKICITPVHCVSRAHDAGILHLLLVRERENTRFLTGSFDGTVGVWSQDGQLIHRLRHFTGVITGICYAVSVKTVWITSGTSHPLLLDPRSGDIITEFVDTFQNQDNSPHIKQLIYLPESSHVIGSSRHNQVTVWKYNNMGCVNVLNTKHPLECLSYTGKNVILLFTGDSRGTFEKWKRKDLSPSTYSKESYNMEDTRPERKGLRCLQKDPSRDLSRRPQSRLQRSATAGMMRKGILFNQNRTGSSQKKCCGYTRSLFADEMDTLVMGAENGDIYLWEFDESVAASVPDEPEVSDEDQLLKEYGFLFAQDTKAENMEESPSKSEVLNKRLIGMTCKKVLAGHYKAVTALAVVGKESGYNTVYLLSGGWDSRLCVWDLNTCSLVETFSRTGQDQWSEHKEKACDGTIMDICYSPKRKEFAYSSSDGKVYIRSFSTVSSRMTLVNILVGHDAEVTSVLWHHSLEKWISGSEDGTIRIWCGDSAQCEKILVTKGAVTCFCIDQVHGSIVAGVQDTIRVYDPESLLQVQCNVGHKDLIRSIVHIPEMAQYVSVSWDTTVRIWKAYQKGKFLQNPGV